MKKLLVIVLLVLGALALGWKWVGNPYRLYLSPPEILGGVVRTETAAGPRLHYLTSQWERRVIRSGGSRSSSYVRTTSWLNVDLWELDAATAQPLARRRIKKEKVNADSKAMGMEQGVLWARIPELVGIRLTDGEIVADRAKIEARNPGLAGLMPKPPQTATFLTESMQPLKFDPKAGMIVRLDDAREVRIDPLTLEATPYVASNVEPAKSENPPPDARSAVISVNHGTNWWVMVRGFMIPVDDGGGKWLGLLADSELAEMKERHAVSYQMDFTVPRRHRLYRGELTRVEGTLGARMEYRNLTALPQSPEFLMGGLLIGQRSDGRYPTALWGEDPDGVFVLSRDRLGDDGRLQLARVSSAEGAPVWSTALPLSTISAWLPGEQHALMLGPAPSAKRSPMAEEGENPAMQILAINLATGALNSFNPDLHRDWPLTEASKKKAP